ncbi:Oidioi.mRNA.OKI2018_I69.chr2.g4978.t1.cds [Oikopleura dioica]|uniref:Oidioi.mRNA.OKI2018_I69.chr2.g4978.t1.cds n=1 Tax=Oikopleura dioica TaxID=34765 RepID=A0ABN7T5M9_OIKDI|nr:Oidioi.mRNA.OKI2018_I69.chr2.g4978.t1.cds [Oikopleura dioica]
MNTPWTPPKTKQTASIINQLTPGEDSAYELYVKAMNEIGSDSTEVTKLVSMIERGQSYENALNSHQSVFGDTIPEAIYDQLRETLRIAEKGSTHEAMAALLYSEEEGLTILFQDFLDNKIFSNGKKSNSLHIYLQKYMHLDQENYRQHAVAAVSEICGKDEKKWSEATAAAKSAIEMKIHFYGEILENLPKVEKWQQQGADNPAMKRMQMVQFWNMFANPNMFDE